MIEPRRSELSFNVAGNPVSQNQAWTIITWKPKAEAAARGVPPHASLKLTSDGAAFKIEVARIAALVRPTEWDRENEYEVTCTYFFDTRRPDCDGPGKLVLDALEDFTIMLGKRELSFTGLYRNDRQVWRFTQQRELDVVQPRTEITVKLRRPWKPQQRELLR